MRFIDLEVGERFYYNGTLLEKTDDEFTGMPLENAIYLNGRYEGLGEIFHPFEEIQPIEEIMNKILEDNQNVLIRLKNRETNA